MILKPWKILNLESMAKRMHCFIFPYCIFCSAELKYSNFSFQIHWCSVITPVFVQNPNVLPAGPTFLLGWAGQRESARSPPWKRVGQTARSWDLGSWTAVLSNGLGNLGFSQRTCSSGAFPMKKGQMNTHGAGKLGNIWSWTIHTQSFLKIHPAVKEPKFMTTHRHNFLCLHWK